MEIELISSEKIKPSSPTPQNLRNYNVSLLDQVTPPIRFPIVIYYPTHPNFKNLDQFISESTKTLKQSLSHLLTRYYPFAGTLKDHISVDCNDEGFLFVVAKVKSNLSDFLKNPDQKEHRRLIPSKLEWNELGPVGMVQINYFNCGGMAFGFALSHKVADGIAMCYFIKSWSLYSYGGCNEPVCPNYISQGFFPYNEALPHEYHFSSCMMRNMKIGKTILRRYVFDARAISTLKAKSGDIFRPSRVEVVSAFLWKCFMSAKKSDKKVSMVTQLVNLRRRAQPSFPDNCFGNWVWMSTATSKYDDENDQLEINLVRKLRESISSIDHDVVMRMHGDDGLSGYCKNVDEGWAGYDKDVAEIFSVSSSCGFDLYKFDFGWGTPIWLNNCGLGGNDSESPCMNSVWLIDSKKGGGIEAWLTLEEEYMKAFDQIEELRVLASVDPNPFDM